MPIGNLRVLIVEDHTFQRNILSKILRSIGVTQIVEATDGKVALDMLQDPNVGLVDIVLCDLAMPEMDGMEFIRHLGELKHSAGVIVISSQDQVVLTAVDRMARAYGIMLLGVAEKPVEIEHIKKLMHSYRPKVAALQEVKAELSSLPEFKIKHIVEGLQRNEFQPFFQPKLSFSSNEVMGAEALARWLHPVHGLIPPAVFISQLEDTKDIDLLTFAILKQTAETWRRNDFDFHVSVNLSVVSLADPKLSDKIIHIVNEADISPDLIVFEITESVAVSLTTIAPALENLTRLRMHGFGLSIDDYGTGFSSMKQLTQIPFTELKIDQSFVIGCANNTAQRIIIESSIDMARRLGLSSVGEGVETIEEWNALQVVGCDMAQGYYISKPVAEEGFIAYCGVQ